MEYFISKYENGHIVSVYENKIWEKEGFVSVWHLVCRSISEIIKNPWQGRAIIYMQDNISNFKILSIDGGGIRGVIPAKILCDLEEEAIKKDGPEARLCDYFDLVCGTSTGGIIAIGIALGMTANEILNLYMKNAPIIFPK